MALSIYSPDAHAMVRAEPLHPLRVQNQITVLELRSAMRQREDNQRAGFAAALERCYSRIRRCASVGRNECAFSIPPAVLGLPLYDVDRCARFVVSHLTKNGFRVTDGDQPLHIHVSWDLSEKTQHASSQHPLQQQQTRRADTWHDDTRLFNRDNASSPHQPFEAPLQQFETPTQPRGDSRGDPSSSSSLGGGGGDVRAFGVTRMTRDEQQRHVEYLKRQDSDNKIIDTSSRVGATGTGRRDGGSDPQQQQRAPSQRSRSPSARGGFLKSIAEFKPSGKFVLRV